MENKEYISQQQENGAVHISEDAIATIAATSAAEVEGVALLPAKKAAPKGVKLTIAENGEITIDLGIYVTIGRGVLETAKAVQKAVASAVSSVTGLTVAAVNVTVSGVEIPKEQKA